MTASCCPDAKISRRHAVRLRSLGNSGRKFASDAPSRAGTRLTRKRRTATPADCCADRGRAAANGLRLTECRHRLRGISLQLRISFLRARRPIIQPKRNDAILPRARSSPFCGDHGEALRMTSAATGKARSIGLHGILKAATYTLELIAIAAGLFRPCRVRAADSLDQSDRDAAVAADRLGAGARAATRLSDLAGDFRGRVFLHRSSAAARSRRRSVSRSARRSRRWPEPG